MSWKWYLSENKFMKIIFNLSIFSAFQYYAVIATEHWSTWNWRGECSKRVIHKSQSIRLLVYFQKQPPEFPTKHRYWFSDVFRGYRMRPATLLKKRLWLRCFPVNFAKFLRTPFLSEHLRTTASLFLVLHKKVVNSVCDQSFSKIETGQSEKR